jgi:hypothetical protein
MALASRAPWSQQLCWDACRACAASTTADTVQHAWETERRERERDDALRWAPFPRGSVAPSVCRRFRFPPLLSRGCYSTTFYDGARGPNQCALHKNTGMQPTKVVTNEDS